MKSLLALLLLAGPSLAAVTGTLVNRTVGQPASGVTVVLNALGQNGVEPVAETKSDAQGRFSFDREIQGPHLLRATFDGVAYFQVLSPGAPTTDLAFDVFNASAQPGAAKVTKHMLFFEPSAAGQMAVQETYLYSNPGKTAWNDPARGELRFYLPPAAAGKTQVNATAPGGLPVPASLVKTGVKDTVAVDFAIKPGDTRFDVSYTVPYTAGMPYTGKVLTPADNTYLIAPRGVTLQGDGLQDLGIEPRTQAHAFGLAADTFKIALTGERAAPAEADTAAEADQEKGPPIEAIPARIYGTAVPILVLSLAILAVGFTLLYRKSSVPLAPAKEANERGRR